MKYLKKFNLTTDYDSYINGDPILPNVSYVVETNGVSYEPKKVFTLRAQYNATPDNLVAFTGASNIKAMKVNGTPIEFEPTKNEITTFDILGENISIDTETGAATFPDSYLIKSPVTSWSFKAKDPNYTINENTYVCMMGLMDGATMVEPIPISSAMGQYVTTNDGVTLELTDAFLALMNEQMQSGLQMGFTLMDVDTNNGTLVFIDTEHQTNVTTGGLSTYSFDSEGSYDVEIELIDSTISMQFAETSLISIEIGSCVTSIGEKAFYDCSSLTSVVIPDSVTSIGEKAFYNCSGLTEIAIGLGVTSIGENAFEGCSGLTSVVIPDSVTSIGEKAFYNCSGLTEVTIGSGVTSIGGNVFSFSGCTGSLYIDCNIPSVINYTSAIFYGSNFTSVEFGPNVTSIGDYAFYSCSLTGELVIPDSVTSIGESAFYGCSKLTGELVIPNSVTSIGYDAFSSCSRLTSIMIPDSVTEIGRYAFHDCSGLTEIAIGLGVTSIGENAFEGCSGLTSVVIPDSVTSISDQVFSGCSGLISITIPNSVTSIGDYVFYDCSGLNEIACLATTSPNISDYAFKNVKTNGILKVPAGSDYSSWMSTDEYYLGYYNWTIQYI